MPTDREVQLAFGRRLRELRERAGHTQEQLAHRAGIDRSYVGQVERGERNITLVNIAKLAGGLDVDPNTLLDGCPPIAGDVACT
jgi:transcriptional regulator with XRE-family HTH domain